MTSYQHSPQDEGYSEDPLTVGTVSGTSGIPHWLHDMPVAERTGKSSRSSRRGWRR
jgi:F-box and WD-40 domain protein 1/11